MDKLDPEARRTTVASLMALREELEIGCDEELWPHVELNAALLLSDVCKAIGLKSRETALVLGERGMQYVLSPVPILLAKSGGLPTTAKEEMQREKVL